LERERDGHACYPSAQEAEPLCEPHAEPLLHQLRRLGEHGRETRRRPGVVPRNILPQNGLQEMLPVLRRLPLARQLPAVGRDEPGDECTHCQVHVEPERLLQPGLDIHRIAAECGCANRVDHLTEEDHLRRLRRAQRQRTQRARHNEQDVECGRKPQEVADGHGGRAAGLHLGLRLGAISLLHLARLASARQSSSASDCFVSVGPRLVGRPSRSVESSELFSESLR